VKFLLTEYFILTYENNSNTIDLKFARKTRSLLLEANSCWLIHEKTTKPKSFNLESSLLISEVSSTYLKEGSED
jgi:hypothetical protein